MYEDMHGYRRGYWVNPGQASREASRNTRCTSASVGATDSGCLKWGSLDKHIKDKCAIMDPTFMFSIWEQGG